MPSLLDKKKYTYKSAKTTAHVRIRVCLEPHTHKHLQMWINKSMINSDPGKSVGIYSHLHKLNGWFKPPSSIFTITIRWTSQSSINVQYERIQSFSEQYFISILLNIVVFLLHSIFYNNERWVMSLCYNNCKVLHTSNTQNIKKLNISILRIKYNLTWS